MKQLLLILLTTLISLNIHAQRNEIGVFLGTSIYQGDLSPGTFSLKEPSIAYGLHYGYSPIDKITIKGGFTRGKIAGDDSNHNSNGLNQRNLSFKSNITELALRVEYNILGYDPERLYAPFSPYVFVGAGATHHNPMAEYEGVWYELQPLGTEGQGTLGYGPKYERVILALPFGFGVKYALTEQLTLGFEVGFRKTFTDYLDDVSTVYVNPDVLLNSSDRGEITLALSNRTGEYLDGEPIQFEDGAQRGNAANDDTYAITGLSLSYNFFSQRKNYSNRNRRGRKMGCRY